MWDLISRVDLLFWSDVASNYIIKRYTIVLNDKVHHLH